jgi:hypothetical protein
MSEVRRTEHLPYELTAEQMAQEQMEFIERRYGRDPRVIMAYLPLILQEFGHNCIELGAELADNFPTTGAGDILEAYSVGVEHGKLEGEKS